ncbi:unnamed protein product, partial [Pylaiella littoralis]
MRVVLRVRVRVRPNPKEEYWLKMVMFLKGNFQFIPDYKDIPNIDSKDIR